MKTIVLITLLACAVLWFAIQPTNDLVARYVGAQQALAGVNPYGDAATNAIQRVYYGRLARSDEDQQRSAYPGYSLFAFAPLALLPFEIRRFEPLLWIGVVMVCHWRRDHVTVLKPQPA